MEQDSEITPDAIIVLTGGTVAYIDIDGSTKYRSTTYEERDNFGTLGGDVRVKAAAILSRRYPEAALVTTSKREGEMVSHARVAADELIALGVDPSRIALEEKSINTKTQIDESFQLATVRGWNKVLFVASDYQVERAAAFARAIPDSIGKFPCISAESILISDSSDFANFFAHIQKTEAYKDRLAAEARGLAAILSGTYASAPSVEKQERPSDLPASFLIGSRRVGPGEPTYIIFEVASTHENNWEAAVQYVTQAAEIGADAVKFQLFTADALLNPLTPGLQGTYDYFKTSETPRDWFPKLKALADEKGIDLLCTPFDSDAVEYLNSVGVPAVKIASGELTNLQLLSAAGALRKPVIVSTGMATMEEVATAVATLRASGAEDIALLQCVSVYPTSFEDANVSVMQTLRNTFNMVIGYSDNGSEGALVPLMSVAMGASIIEKHVTGNKERGSIDDKFSLSVEQFSDLIRRIREIEHRTDKEAVLNELHDEFGKDFEKALGDGIKRPGQHGTEKTHPGVSGSFIMRESDERHWARRGVYLSHPVAKGMCIEEDMLTLLRPDVGISGVDYSSVIGKAAGEDLAVLHPLKIVGDSVFHFHKSDISLVYKNSEDVAFAQMLEDGGTFA
jgi:sialic acid synthase SpsE/uncharacterized SAM-binding protein YcdF (DUF218 family)